MARVTTEAPYSVCYSYVAKQVAAYLGTSVDCNNTFRVGHGSGPSVDRVGSGRVVSQNSSSWVDQVASGPVTKMSNKYTITRNKPIIRRVGPIIHNDKKL